MKIYGTLLNAVNLRIQRTLLLKMLSQQQKSNEAENEPIQVTITFEKGIPGN
jgi:hypothetical protein